MFGTPNLPVHCIRLPAGVLRGEESEEGGYECPAVYGRKRFFFGGAFLVALGANLSQHRANMSQHGTNIGQHGANMSQHRATYTNF